MMRQPMPSPSIQHFCLSYVLFTLLPSPTNGRAHSWLSPSPAPLLSPLLNPVSAPPVLIAPSPTATKVIVVVQHHHSTRELIISISLSSVAVLVIALFIILLLVTWQRQKLVRSFKDTQNYDYATKGLHSDPTFSKLNSLKMVDKKTLVARIEYSSLKSATNNFDEKYILEEGRFGCVYESCLDGVPAAIMKLDGYGRDQWRIFDNELDLLGRIRHPNVISLLGYCVHGETRFLVYGLLNNGSVQTILHGSSHGSALTWHLRMKIALDTARGLEYLHEHCYPPVIHGDLKPSNILLDLDYNAKISGFGLAVTDADQNKRMAKSFGKLDYATPEYILDGKLSEKSDVYAFGVVLLELLIGRKTFEKIATSQCQSLVTWATPLLTDRLLL
ncbi:probable receptor-like protein kinase At1g80640 isoform X2 [Phalaenopsis equestris]|uniref:probable receptor-like protein kinase At1g80640 isoform X2 n=1 Tax=Phalaenopsis equestris TaxID=78828 RepID=UPI0009E56C41|nr:probable receptor-like protein kinase At1g80640 isoform X2 [Phalaenopsis equestris]